MTRYTLDLEPKALAAAPVLDAAQRRVVEHEGGPLLVLAGPGTGKTTTMVEAIVSLVQQRQVPPDQILALTFSRKAAESLRDRVISRLGGTTSSSLSATFHSFGYSLIREFTSADRAAMPLRLLSAAEQDVALRELLLDPERRRRWPPDLAEAIGTRGFARELNRLLSRAREQRVDGATLRQFGLETHRPSWAAAGEFLEEYLAVLDQLSALDYANLIYEAVNIAEHPQVQPILRDRHRYVFVDEYQDTDPSQVALLQAIAGQGKHLVVVGDPDQSIYGFRGAEVRGILNFPTEFPTHAGAPAPTIALGTTRRFGRELLTASRRLAASLPLHGPIPRSAWETFRQPVSECADPGELQVFTVDSERAQAEHIAEQLRRAHLEQGLPWSEMAVLVRAGRSTLPSLRRLLVNAGVPCEVASDETPLAAEPAVLPLLGALQAAINRDNDDPGHPHYVDEARAEALLLSPLTNLDAADLRRLARSLRQLDAAEPRARRPSAALLRSVVLGRESALLAHHDLRHDSIAARVREFVELLEAAHQATLRGEAAEQVLWLLWSGTSWPHRLRQQALKGSGSQQAHRDLDAVCALFEQAARLEEKQGFTSTAAFLETLNAQQIPGDTLADRGIRGDAVRLMTAHRSKGLEWQLVVVAYVQEGVWPDLRRRSSLLHAEELGAEGEVDAVTTRELLAEERRVFYVAVTRAARRLIVTAVRSSDEDGEQPSRFLQELAGKTEVPHRAGRPARPLALPAVVAELRQLVCDPSSSAALREAAAQRLAALSDLRHQDRALVPGADPEHWWGLRALTQAAEPLQDPTQPVTLSPSGVDALLTCPARWFLEREAGGQQGRSSAQGFGELVHLFADRIAREEISAETDLGPWLRQVWSQLDFRTPWSAAREFDAVMRALDLFKQHHALSTRTVVCTEGKLSVTVELPDGEKVTLRGTVDRLELDEAGHLTVVDLKTGKSGPTAAELQQHRQLAIYQYMVLQGAAQSQLDQRGLHSSGEVAGAELWQLRLAKHLGALVKAQEPIRPLAVDSADREIAPAEAAVIEDLRAAAGLLRTETFPALVNPVCETCAFSTACPAQQNGSVLS